MSDESDGSGESGGSSEPGGAESSAASPGWLTAAEVAGLVAPFGFGAVGALGDGSSLSTAPRPVRVAALLFVTAQFLIPVWVFLDVRRRPEMGTIRVHAAAIPVLNVFGLAASLAERGRKLDGE